MPWPSSLVRRLGSSSAAMSTPPSTQNDHRGRPCIGERPAPRWSRGGGGGGGMLGLMAAHATASSPAIGIRPSADAANLGGTVSADEQILRTARLQHAGGGHARRRPPEP